MPRVFFYGSYINYDVLAQSGIRPASHQVARLPGFDIRIAPLANLVPVDEHTAYGIVTEATHAELARLYQHAHDVLGQTYLPEAVLVQTTAGAFLPALCYLAPSMTPRPVEADYVERIAGPARRYGFPAWYLERIERYRPA